MVGAGDDHELDVRTLAGRGLQLAHRGGHRDHRIARAIEQQDRHADLVERQCRVVLDLLAPARGGAVAHGFTHI